MRGGDTHDQLLARLREYQQIVIDQVARGNVSGAEGVDGYWSKSGIVRGLDMAIMLTEEILFGRRPEQPDPGKPFDPLGIFGGQKS